MSVMPPKRRSTGAGSSVIKKAKTDIDHGPAAALASEILDAPDMYPISEDDADVREVLVQLAKYARYLEERIEAGSGGGSGGGSAVAVPRQKTREVLEEAADKIRKAAQSGIQKQMKVGPLAFPSVVRF